MSGSLNQKRPNLRSRLACFEESDEDRQAEPTKKIQNIAENTQVFQLESEHEPENPYEEDSPKESAISLPKKSQYAASLIAKAEERRLEREKSLQSRARKERHEVIAAVDQNPKTVLDFPVQSEEDRRKETYELLVSRTVTDREIESARERYKQRSNMPP